MGYDPHNLVFVRVDAEGGGLSDERKFQDVQDAMIRLQTVSGGEGGDGFEAHAIVGQCEWNRYVRAGTRL